MILFAKNLPVALYISRNDATPQRKDLNINFFSSMVAVKEL